MTAEIDARIPFDALGDADLVVDAVYEGGRQPSIAADPLARLLPVGNQGGFRAKRRPDGGGWAMAVLFTSGGDPDWPDVLDLESGRFTYYGDNKRPGKELHETPRGGNRLLREGFAAAHAGPEHRATVPPFFVFSLEGAGRDVRFRGLAVPGADGVPPSEDLVAIWRVSEGRRFQNYRATFTVLAVPHIPRAWIRVLARGEPLGPGCPGAFREWIETGTYRPLLAERTLDHRRRGDQLPVSADDRALVRTLYEHFRADPHAFEPCAAELWRLSAGASVVALDVTRRSRDGGRDAIGKYALGPLADRVLIDFALEAKCYEPGGKGVGVREVARLVSRLRHRQFGVLVTTSHVDEQAYREVREDGHPIVVLCGRDIAEILRTNGLNGRTVLREWLERRFPVANAGGDPSP